jgi:hypothetical protein
MNEMKSIPGCGLSITNVKGETFKVHGPVTYIDFVDCGRVYYCGGFSWPEQIVTEVLE